MNKNKNITALLLNASADEKALYETCLINDTHYSYTVIERQKAEDLPDLQTDDNCVILYFCSSGKAIKDISSDLDSLKSGLIHIPLLIIADSQQLASIKKKFDLDETDYCIKDEISADILIKLVHFNIKLKAAEKQLLESQVFINTLIDTIPNPVFYRDIDGTFMRCNSAFEDIIGKSRKEIIGKTIYDIAHKEDADFYDRTDREVINASGIRSYEAQIINPARGLIDVIINKGIFTGSDGNVEGIVGVMADISERKKTERELKKLNRAVEQSPASVVITDMNGNIEYVNPKFTNLTGYTFGEAVGQNPRILKSGIQDGEYYRTMWETITAGKQWAGEFHNKKKNGDLYWELASISPLLNEDGKITHFIAVKEDITERKNAEEALRISENRLKKRNSIMEQELKLAQVTQRALILRETPKLDYLEIDYRYLPLEEVGGDFFSLSTIDSNNLGVFIGDVSGHGVASALFLALLKSMTDRMFTKYPREPSLYLENLNSELIGYMSSYFITGIYGYFEHIHETSEVKFTYAKGGHPDPILIKSDNSGEIIKTGGKIIGFLDNIKFEEKSVTLKKGDSLFLITDGIPEAQNHKKEIIGFENELLDLFKHATKGTLSKTLDSIIKSCDDYRDGKPVGDDIILLGFKVK